MGKVVWSDGALADLGIILRYIARDNPAAAQRLGQNILEVTKLLSTFPKMGRVYSKSKRKSRCIPHKSYLIFYNEDEGRRTIEILRILHGARDVSPLD
jgi:toxin ParE1/3/4